MSPIEGLSNIIRLPRLGKLHLGIKVEKPGKSPSPQATDHFVCPPEVQTVFGEKPTELEIMFPVEDPELFAQQWLRAYSLTQGLICIGNGVTSRRKIDLGTGGIAGHNTKGWQWKDELPCDPQECPEYAAKKCRRVMNLQFLMPKVEGLGVWQIDTSSFYSIVNINSMIKLVKSLCGRISFIPLTLCLGPIEVSPPGMTKKTVYIMHIKQKVKLAELLQAAQKEPSRVLLPEPEVEEAPEDLYPEEVLEGRAVDEDPRPAPPAPQENPMSAWDEMRELIKEVKPSEESLAKWWKEKYAKVVTLADFRYSNPPQKFGGSMIIAFRDWLKKLKTEQGQAELPL